MNANNECARLSVSASVRVERRGDRRGVERRGGEKDSQNNLIRRVARQSGAGASQPNNAISLASINRSGLYFFAIVYPLCSPERAAGGRRAERTILHRTAPHRTACVTVYRIHIHITQHTDILHE